MGQMSLWGWLFIAPDAYLIFFKFIFIIKGCLDKIINVFIEVIEPGSFIIFNSIAQITPIITNSNISNNKKIRILAKDRIGPHNIVIISILFGSLDPLAKERRRRLLELTERSFPDGKVPDPFTFTWLGLSLDVARQ